MLYDARMTKEEILHLGTLSRIALNEEEVATFGESITAILAYVSEIQSIAGTNVGAELPTLRNVFRKDEVTNEPGSFTEDILNEAPCRHGAYIEVKKILSNDE